MALSTSEFVGECMSTSSVGGGGGVGSTSASSLEVGLGARPVEAWLAGSPDTPLPAKMHEGRSYASNDNKLHDRLFSYLYRGVSVLIAFLLSLPNPDACG